MYHYYTLFSSIKNRTNQSNNVTERDAWVLVMGGGGGGAPGGGDDLYQTALLPCSNIGIYI